MTSKLAHTEVCVFKNNAHQLVSVVVNFTALTLLGWPGDNRSMGIKPLIQ